MLTYVLDASSLLRAKDGEAGSARVDELFEQASVGLVRLQMSAVNWGEIITVIMRRHGSDSANLVAANPPEFLELIHVTAERAVRAGILKATYKIPYADCFGVELAQDSPQHILLTADFDPKPAESLIQIEFLPPK